MITTHGASMWGRAVTELGGLKKFPTVMCYCRGREMRVVHPDGMQSQRIFFLKCAPLLKYSGRNTIQYFFPRTNYHTLGEVISQGKGIRYFNLTAILKIQ